MNNERKIKYLHKLEFKIASFVMLTILIIFGCFSIYEFLHYEKKLTDLASESSILLSQALTVSLEIAMIHSDIEKIQRCLEEISEQQDIVSIFLLNMAMEVRASSDDRLIGTKKTLADQGCRNCHDLKGTGELPRAITLDDQPVLRVVVPVNNKPDCHRCHDPSNRINGLLVLDHSLQPIRAEMYSSIKWTGMVTGLSILVILLLFRWYIRKQVINRVAYLESLARRIVNNELDLDIQLSGKDELAYLAGSFNNMKRTLKLSIERIEDHRNYLTNLLNNLTDGIFIVDDKNNIVFANESIAEVLEVDNSQVKIGCNVMDLLQKDKSISQITELIEQARRQKSRVQDIIRLKFPDAREKHLEIHAGQLALPPLRNPEVIIGIRDITDIISIEKQVYQADKLATIGRLAAGVAHEINNPMASILTCAEGLLRSKYYNEDEVKEYMEIIRNSARRCKMITHKLLDYSVTSNIRNEAVDIRAALDEAVSLLQFEVSKKNATLTVAGDDAIPEIRGSKDSLVQVFVNLILNSIQAIDNKGKIDINLNCKNSCLDIRIIDNGCGISEENRERVFDPFFTTKPVGVGTGLGLSVSLGIIKQHNGQIKIVESRNGFTSLIVSFSVGSSKRKENNE